MVYCNSGGDQIADSDLKAKKQPSATGLCSRDLQLMVAYIRLHSRCLQKTLSPKQSVVEESRQGTTERPCLAFLGSYPASFHIQPTAVLQQ